MPSADVELAIAGAGPAGARAAAVLARQGLSVKAFDAGSCAQPKLCGGLLNRRCQQLLIEARLDLPEQVRVGAGQVGLEYPALEYHDLTHRMRGRYHPGYRNIDRGAFDAWLRELARDAGAVIHPHQRVRGLRQLPDGVELTLADGQLRAGALIDATGCTALSRRLLSPSPQPVLNCIQGEIRLDPAPDAMWGVYHPAFAPFFAWIIPKGEGRFLAGAGFGAAKAGMPSRPGPAVRAISRELPGAWPMLRVLLEYLDWRGHRVELLASKPRGAPLAHTLDQARLWWGTERVYTIGEAAGLVSPFSGEGLSYALSSAQAAAACIVPGKSPQALAPQLQRELAALKRAQAKAWIAARGWLRPAGFALLPLIAGPVAQRPWRS